MIHRYDSKIQLSRGLRCMNRCSAPQTSPIQIHDPTVHGRIFTCQLCLFDVCTTCDRPEHFGESCEEYLEREATAHGKDEALTMEDHWPCPGCNVTIELEERGCGFTVCKTCNFRFCQDCLIGWVGEGSEYELGAAAHEPGCNYTVKYSAHSLKYIKDKRSKTLKEAAEKRKIGEKKAAEAKKRKADDQDAEVEAEKVSKKAKHQVRQQIASKRTEDETLTPVLLRCAVEGPWLVARRSGRWILASTSIVDVRDNISSRNHWWASGNVRYRSTIISVQVSTLEVKASPGGKGWHQKSLFLVIEGIYFKYHQTLIRLIVHLQVSCTTTNVRCSRLPYIEAKRHHQRHQAFVPRRDLSSPCHTVVFLQCKTSAVTCPSV